MDSDFGNYISLRQASKLCEYSQDYLNLLVRKRKLRALKIGRNWVTTSEWLESYLQSVKDGRNKRIKPAPITDQSLLDRYLPAPEISSAVASISDDVVGDKIGCPVPQKKSYPVAIFVSCWAVAFICASFAFSFFPGHDFFANRVGPLSQRIFVDAGLAAVKIPAMAASSLSGAGVRLRVLDMAKASATGDGLSAAIGKTNSYIKNKLFAFGDYLFHGKTEIIAVTEPAVDGVVLQKSIDDLETNMASGGKNRFDDFRKEFDAADSVPAALPSSQQGVVVVPLAGDAAQTREKIKENFSDQVAVKPVDNTSGIIVPQFKNKQGDDYLYMMVPVKNN